MPSSTGPIRVSKGLVSVSLFGQDKGYMVKYIPLDEGVPKGTPEGKGVYLTLYPES